MDHCLKEVGSCPSQEAGPAGERKALGQSHEETQPSLGETTQLIGCSLNIQQPAAANLYRKCYTLLLNAAAL